MIDDNSQISGQMEMRGIGQDPIKELPEEEARAMGVSGMKGSTHESQRGSPITLSPGQTQFRTDGQGFAPQVQNQPEMYQVDIDRRTAVAFDQNQMGDPQAQYQAQE